MNRGLLINQVRHRLGLTQKEFGSMIGVTLDEVSKWERGIRSINDPRMHQVYYYTKKLLGEDKADLYFKEFFKSL